MFFTVFILTDWLRYKPVVCIEGLSYIGCWALLLWGRGVGAMQLMECFYGVATSTEVAYYTYIYSQVYNSSPNYYLPMRLLLARKWFSRWKRRTFKEFQALPVPPCSSEGLPVEYSPSCYTATEFWIFTRQVDTPIAYFFNFSYSYLFIEIL